MSRCSKCGLVITSEYQYAHEKLCGGQLVAQAAKPDHNELLALLLRKRLDGRTDEEIMSLAASALRALSTTVSAYEVELATTRESLNDACALLNSAKDECRKLRASWNSPDALRTRVTQLTQNPYSPVDSVDSPQPKGDQ